MDQLIISIATDIQNHNGRAYIVGGYVRDMIMNIPSNDMDIVVVGLTKDQLRSILSVYGNVSEPTGPQSFPVLKLNNELDFALARRDNRTGYSWMGS